MRKKRHYKTIFTTRKSFGFLLGLILLIIIFLLLMIINIYESKNLSAVTSLLIVSILMSFLLNNKIVLEQYYIRVNFGIFNYCIKYKDIKDIYISDNNLLSFASSYHKVGIKTLKYKSKLFDTFLSPMDREDFIYEVNKRR